MKLIPKRTSLRIILALSLAVVVFLSYTVWRAFHPDNKYTTAQLKPYLEATSVQVYSVSPYLSVRDDPSRFTDSNYTPKPLVTEFGEFHGRPVLGYFEATSKADLASIASAVHELDQAGKHWANFYAACFNPRHGLRVTTSEGTHDMLICYECAHAILSVNGEKVGDIYMASDQAKAEPTILNALLDAHGIKREEEIANQSQ